MSGKCCKLSPTPPPPPDGLTYVPPEDEHKIEICRFDSVLGPFVDKDGGDCITEGGESAIAGGGEIFGSHGAVYAPGGEDLYYDSSLESVIIYYRYHKSLQISLQYQPKSETALSSPPAERFTPNMIWMESGVVLKRMDGCIVDEFHHWLGFIRDR